MNGTDRLTYRPTDGDTLLKEYEDASKRSLMSCRVIFNGPMDGSTDPRTHNLPRDIPSYRDADHKKQSLIILGARLKDKINHKTKKPVYGD